MLTCPGECLVHRRGEVKGNGEITKRRASFFSSHPISMCHGRRIVWRKAVRWEDNIKMNLLNIVWILGYLATLLLHSVESDDNMIMDIRRPRSGFGRRLLCLMSRCPLDMGYQLHRALDLVKRALRQPETWCMFRAESQTARYCGHGLPRCHISPTLMYVFMVWLTTLSVATSVPGVATTWLRLAPAACEQQQSGTVVCRCTAC